MQCVSECQGMQETDEYGTGLSATSSSGRTTLLLCKGILLCAESRMFISFLWMSCQEQMDLVMFKSFFTT